MGDWAKKYAGRQVVVDTDSRWLYLGIFKGEDSLFVTLAEADAFDYSETSLSKHEYIMMVKNDGVAPNRKEVNILKGKIVAVTLLADTLGK